MSSSRAPAYLFGVLLLIGTVVGGLNPAHAADATVDIVGTGQVQETITIGPGESVTFTNTTDEQLSVVAEDQTGVDRAFETVTIEAHQAAAVQPSRTTNFDIVGLDATSLPETRDTGQVVIAEPDPDPTTEPEPDPTVPPTTPPDPTPDPTTTTDPVPSPDPQPSPGPVLTLPTTLTDLLNGFPGVTITPGATVTLPALSPTPTPSVTPGEAGQPVASPDPDDGFAADNDFDDTDHGFATDAKDFILTAGGLVQPSSPRRWGVPIVLAVVMVVGVASLVLRVLRGTGRGKSGGGSPLE